MFWQKSSGLLAFKQSYCPNYYGLIHEAERIGAWEQYPSIHFTQIDKDMNRTFPAEAFFTDEIKESMRRVFRAYVWRNPQVGYIQGINFPFFRVRKYLSEEDTFWLMCLVIETYLPPDFSVEMNGATTHATILCKIFTQYAILPNLLKTFDAMDYPLVNLTAKLFLSLFSNSLPEEASLRVLDLFFLDGRSSNKVIFDVTLAYLRVIEDRVVSCRNQEELQEALDPSNYDFMKGNILINNIKHARQELKQAHIDFYRPVSHKEVLDANQRQIA